MSFFRNPKIIYITFLPLQLRLFSSSNTTEVYRKNVPCPLRKAKRHDFGFPWCVMRGSGCLVSTLFS